MYLARPAYFSVFFVSSLEEVGILHRTKSAESVEGRVRDIIVVKSLFGKSPRIGSEEKSGAHKPEQATSMPSCRGVFPRTSLYLERFWREF